MNRTKPEITNVRPAGDEHQVASVAGGSGAYRRRPCGGPESTTERPGCPWRADAVGHFPPELASGAIDLARVDDGGHELHAGYISMALANGADPARLRGCRLSHEEESSP